MVGLDQLRSSALVAVDPQAVAEYAAVGSAAHESDVKMVEALAEAGVRPVGLATRIVGVEVIEAAGDSARLRVVDERGAYRLESGAGSVVDQIAAAGRRTWVVTVERGADAGSWRVVRVAAA